MVTGQTRILVVDDDPLNTKTLVDIFTLNRYKVDSAVSAEEALLKIKKEHYMVVLTDIRMPEMNGVELLQKAKAFTPQTVFILMTAYADDELMMEGIQEGALVIMVKPLNIDGLLFHISKLSESFRV